jgi:hypothetical protein
MIACNGSSNGCTCQIFLVFESSSSCIRTFQTLIEPFPSLIASISSFIEPFPSLIDSISSFIEKVLIEIESCIRFIGSFLPEHGSIIVDKVRRILANGSMQAGNGSRFTCRASFQVALGSLQTPTESPQDRNGSLPVCIVSVKEDSDRVCRTVVSRHKINAALPASHAYLPIEEIPVLVRNASFLPGEEKAAREQALRQDARRPSILLKREPLDLVPPFAADLEDGVGYRWRPRRLDAAVEVDGHPPSVSAPSFESAAPSRTSRQQTRAVGSDGFELQSCALLGASCAPPQPGPGLQAPPAAVQPFPELDDAPHATPTMARRSASVTQPVVRRRDIAP